MQNNKLVLNNNVVPISSSRKAQINKPLWWEAPLDEFVEMLQALYRDHAPYFSQIEMEEVYHEVSLYALQRGKLWDEQIKLGVSPEYLQYLADDLTGYLRHIYQFLREDIMDRKTEYKATQQNKRPQQIVNGNVIKIHLPANV